MFLFTNSTTSTRMIFLRTCRSRSRNPILLQIQGQGSSIFRDIYKCKQMTSTFSTLSEIKSFFNETLMRNKPDETSDHDSLELEESGRGNVMGTLTDNNTATAGLENVPFLVPSHVIQKAHIVNATTHIPNAADKFSWLTKTYLNQSNLPEESVIPAFECEKSYQNFQKAFERSLHQAAAFQRVAPHEWKVYQEEATSLGLVNDLLKIALTNKEKDHMNDSFLDHLPTIVTHWMRDFHFYEITFKPTFVLRTSNPVFIPVSELSLDTDITASTNMPKLCDPYSLGVFKHPIIKLKNFPGFHHSKHYSKPHVHTIVQVNSHHRSESQIHAHGIMTMFSQLLSLAMDNGYHLGTVLPEPMTSQCIITNGHEVTFMVYRLNTLDLLTDKGIWNTVWSSGVLPLYHRPDGGAKRSIFETVDFDKIENLNIKAIDLFLQFLRRPTTAE